MVVFDLDSSCAVPINDIRGVEAMGYAKGEKILRCKLAALFRLIDLYGWSQGIYNHITVSFVTFLVYVCSECRVGFWSWKPLTPELMKTSIFFNLENKVESLHYSQMRQGRIEHCVESSSCVPYSKYVQCDECLGEKT